MTEFCLFVVQEEGIVENAHAPERVRPQENATSIHEVGRKHASVLSPVRYAAIAVVPSQLPPVPQSPRALDDPGLPGVQDERPDGPRMGVLDHGGHEVLYGAILHIRVVVD